eukprot:2158897-Amphidinium_carterae.1
MFLGAFGCVIVDDAGKADRMRLERPLAQHKPRKRIGTAFNSAGFVPTSADVTNIRRQTEQLVTRF